MQHSPLLLAHIGSGTLGCLSGFSAAFVRKGSRQHAILGNVFVVSMLCLATSGISLAIIKSQPGNVMGGTLTFYLVATAWLTGRRRDFETGNIDWIALLFVGTVMAFNLTYGLEAALNASGTKYGYPPGPYFFLGSVATLATIGDVRLLARGGIAGTQRIARHLWRMCFAFFIASASIFLARPHLFPALMRKTGMLYVLSFLPLGLMIFWLFRVRLSKRFRRAWGSPASRRASVKATSEEALALQS